MKISILVPGRLHGFEMALYFQKIGVLNQLVTGYPKKYVIPFGIKNQFVKSLYINEIINRTTNWLRLGYPLDFLACEAFDYLASKTIRFNSDVYFIWSGYGLRTIRKIRQNNPIAKIIIVRGSAHIEEHEELLRTINNSKKTHINPKIIAKELLEYEACDYVTIPSTYAYNSFIKRSFPSEKLFINILGVNLQDFPYRNLATPINEIILGYVGTLSKQKNVAALINVVYKLNQKTPKFKLILAGPIEHTSFDDNLLKYDFITYYGKLPQHELYKIYQKITVFILNSIQDGFGMVLLQAMSSGCSIIATQNTGGPDVVINYHNGIIIPPMNDEALENALLWLNEHKNNIPLMGQKSRNISEKNFTWDDFGRRNMEFITKILNN